MTPEDDIHQLLHALGTAEPPPGIENRLLSRLERHAAAADPAPRHRLSLARKRSPLQRRLIGPAIAAAAIVAVALCVPLAGRHTANQPSRHPSTQARNPDAIAAHLIPHLIPESVPPQPSVAPPSTSAAAITRVAARPPSTASALTTAPMSGDERQLQEDLRAASHPAPPVPLTTQEWLLMHMAQTRNAVQLASLSADLQTLKRQRADLDFQAFFQPPPAPHQPTYVPEPATAQPQEKP